MNLKHLAPLALALTLSACGNKPEENVSSATAKTQPSFAAKIAVIDAGQFVPNVENAPQTLRIHKALGGAGEACGMTEETIGNSSAAVAKIIQDDGSPVQIIDLLEMLPSLTTPNQKMDCQKLLAQYAAVRHSGMNHPEAVVGLRGLLDTIAKIGN